MATFDVIIPTPGAHVAPEFDIIVPAVATSFSPDDVNLSSAVASALLVTVTCSLAPETSASILTPANWVLERVAPLVGVTPTISSISIVGSQLLFVTSKQTIGQSYRLRPDGAAGVRVGQSVTFTGAGTRPNVSNAQVVDGVIRVTFSEPMLRDANLLDASKYRVTALDRGPLVRCTGVTAPSGTPTYVDLSFAGGRGGKSYRVTVNVDA